MTPELDIVIPVYNEGRNIVAVLAALKRAVATPARVLICYDHAEDDTLPRFAPTRRRMPGCRSSSCATTPAAACTARSRLALPRAPRRSC